MRQDSLGEICSSLHRVSFLLFYYCVMWPKNHWQVGLLDILHQHNFLVSEAYLVGWTNCPHIPCRANTHRPLLLSKAALNSCPESINRLGCVWGGVGGGWVGKTGCRWHPPGTGHTARKKHLLAPMWWVSASTWAPWSPWSWAPWSPLSPSGLLFLSDLWLPGLRWFRWCC